jgi:pimeloyl-ACP methyl ester carboxylesterase
MRWVLWVPTVDEVAEVLVAILRREGVARCCLVGHSYGTAVASRLLQQHPDKVVQTCMIDPVSERGWRCVLLDVDCRQWQFGVCGAWVT